MRSSGRLLLSRIGQQRQPYSPVALHSASFVRFYTSDNPSEEPTRVWNAVKSYLGWNKNKQEVHVVVVPETEAYVIERHGGYVKTLTSGIHSLVSTHDKVAHVYSLKEQTISIPGWSAITKENFNILIDGGSLYVKIVDPKLVSYAVDKPVDRVMLYAQAIISQEIGRMTLDEICEKKDTLNERILMRINDVVKDWGFTCLRYDIGNISLPTKVKEAMEMADIARRKAKAQILEAKAQRQANIKFAEEKMMSTILAAQEEAKSIVLNAHSTAARIQAMSKMLKR